MFTDERTWRVGDLARATGLTVRTLHHYDALGLLVPARRSEAGYRLYGDADVRRLYRIVALRRLGLSLEEIGAALDDDAQDVRATVARQLADVERRLGAMVELREHLRALGDALEGPAPASVDHLIATMEAITMYERYFTTDQLDDLRRRGDELGPEAIAGVEREWRELFAALAEERDAGTDPADPRLDDYRVRSRELLEQFTGGDPEMFASMNRMWSAEDPAQLSQGAVDTELFSYAREVFAARR